MIKKKYIDGSQDPKPGKAMSEFHCSRPWFPEEKPTKFKKVEKGLTMGGMAYQCLPSASSKSQSVKVEDDLGDCLLVQNTAQKVKHLAHLLK